MLCNLIDFSIPLRFNRDNESLIPITNTPIYLKNANPRDDRAKVDLRS